MLACFLLFNTEYKLMGAPASYQPKVLHFQLGSFGKAKVFKAVFKSQHSWRAAMIHISEDTLLDSLSSQQCTGCTPGLPLTIIFIIQRSADSSINLQKVKNSQNNNFLK